MTDVHSCSYYCDRPECIKAQRDELRERLAQPERHELQTKGEHPAPCARHCEANAFQIVIKNLQAQLAQPEQDPVFDCPRCGHCCPQRTWVGLTEEQIKLVMDGRGEEDDDDYVKPAFDQFGISEDDLMNFALAIEAKLKKKNT